MGGGASKTSLCSSLHFLWGKVIDAATDIDSGHPCPSSFNGPADFPTYMLTELLNVGN